MGTDDDPQEGPWLVPVVPVSDGRRLPVAITVGALLVAAGLSFVVLPRLSPMPAPAPSVGPTEPTDEHVEAARWVTGYLKYLYQLPLYPRAASSPTPEFLFTKRGLSEALAEDS